MNQVFLVAQSWQWTTKQNAGISSTTAMLSGDNSYDILERGL